MIQPALVDLRAFRGVPFSDTTDFEGQDYGTAAFRMELRDYRDSPALLVGLNNSGSGEGISCIVYQTEAGPVSSVTMRINETTLEQLSFSNPRGGDRVMVYALDVTGGGLGKHRRMYGKFILEASANG